MTKKEIIEEVSEKTTTKKAHTRAIVESVLDVFMEILASEGRIEIRNFGVFKVKDTPARIGRNPVTREVADVPARRIIQFKAGKFMKDIVNGAEESAVSVVKPKRLEATGG
ncbi:MAG: HU family DNA-binding protein [Candidatus Omnitrophica bacterium]|nr:DNA-binding protein HRL53 [bacterium]NUN98262.1 HU family DNA-binding protein [Candidatus Omnitrophota bacterium]